MKNIIVKNSIFLLLSLLLFGCDDTAFLTEKPDTFYTVDNAFSTSEQVDQVVVGCYRHVRSISCYEGNLLGADYSVGNGTDMFDVNVGGIGNSFNNYGIMNPDHGVFNSVYSTFYELIARANLALYAAELPQIVWGSAENKAYVTGQARFFRAFCYRNLGELFGGVPIVTEVTTAPRYDFTRTLRIETYQYAIDEMEAILNDMPVTTSVPGRLVRGAVQHNLCQLYIDKGVVLEEEGKAGEAKTAYDKAINYGNDIINGSTYSLMTERFGTRMNENPDYYFASTVAEQTPDRLYSAAGYGLEGNVYWDLFQEGNQDYQSGNREAIWVAQIDYAAYREGDWGSVLQYSRFLAPADVNANAPGLLEDTGGRGIGGVPPTSYTRDIVYEGQWADDMRNSEAVFRRVFLGSIPSSPYFGIPIPWSVIYREDDSQEIRDYQYLMIHPISCKVATDKYTGLADGQNRSNLFRDEYLIRLPETILLRAEAKMRAGDNAGAANDINLLRARAKCGYMVQTSDINLDLILDERARELIYEERRWNTLLRMGGTVAVERIRRYAYWDYPRVITKNFNLWPIPQSVIDTNKDVVLEQNPGW